MSVFGNYSQYYDLLYKDKDYQGETDFIHSLIQKNHPSPKTVLNLGCGTGAHDFLLSKYGYECVGVDLSNDMLAMAKEKQKRLSNSSVSFHQGDVRTVRLNKKFDVVVSLFHVLSYQVTNDDVMKMLQTVKEHLNPGGIFIVDFWYGPAVLTEQPSVKVKRLENEAIKVVRIAEPKIDVNKNFVDVNYSITIEEKATHVFSSLYESHRMRYFFLPELEQYLHLQQLPILSSAKWMTTEPPSTDSWGVHVIAKAR